MYRTEDLTKGAVAIDIETTGLDWHDRMISVSLAKMGSDGWESLVLNTGYTQKANLFGMAFGDKPDIRDREIMPLKPPEARLAFQAFIKGASCLIFHNGSFDIPYIVRSGIMTREELEDHLVFDTMVWARCTGSHESVSLDSLVEDFGVVTSADWRKTKDLRDKLVTLPWNEVEEYSRLDAIYTLQIGLKMIPNAVNLYESQGHELIEEESAWIKLISLMRVDGIQIDVQAVKAKLAELKKRQVELARELMSYQIRGPNHRTSLMRWVVSIDQVRNLETTDKGNPSFSESSLRNLTGKAVPVVDLILEARRIEKEISTWVEAPLQHADQAGRIHPSFMVSGAKSNRLTCKNPSAHTFPKSMEDILFTARPGYRLVVLDYKAAELRLAASYANERVLIDEFQKEDADPHMRVARLIYGPNATKEQRRRTKNGIFSRNYGAGPRRFVMTVNRGIDPKDDNYVTDAEGERIYNEIKRNMPGITRTSKVAEHTWQARGYLKVMGGKRVYASKTDLQRAYKAFNYLIQPSVAELVKKAMIAMKRAIPEIILVSQKHDSIAFEVPDDSKLESRIQQARTIMEDSYPDYMRHMTDPPILMRADLEADRPGLPYPTETGEAA